MKSVRLFSAALLLALTSCVSPQNPVTSQNHPEVYPGSDDIEISEYTQAVAPYSPERSVASNEVILPKDYEAGKIFTLIKEPSVLQELERRGFNLAYHLEHENRNTVLNSDLIRTSKKYQAMVQVLDSDISELMAQEKKARGDAYVGVGIRYSNRIFDTKWFRSKIANYQLVGIMNRLDRVAFDANSCGELRFVYRLGYDQGPKGIQSRLPMTMLVKYTVKGKAYPNAEWNLCKRMVKQWTYPQVNGNASALVDWIQSPQGPLAPAFLEPQQLHSIEVNMQAFRIPSSIRPDFGGHGSYLMRVFKPTGDSMTPMVLENTPDVDKILANPALLAKLKTMMKDRHIVNRIDAGVWMMPEEFLATRAYSYSPMGLSRKDNRLFHKLLSESDFNPAHFTPGHNQYVKTPEAMIRRLNDLSCVGCHQGRATAGFHFLGIDRKETHAFNSLAFEGSGHFQLEMIRRNEYMQRVARNLVPDPTRDFSFAPPKGTKAKQGHFCGLAGQKSFDHWTCDAGLECLKVDGIASDNVLGKCFPKVRQAGAPCSVGNVTQSDFRHDTLKDMNDLACGDGKKQYGCSPIRGGFPSGMCNTKCNSLDPNTEICAHIAGAGFTDCVGTGKPFEQCLDGSAQSGRGICNDNISCRNDYVCARSTATAGNCTPSYFMFQIRLDGHPTPPI